MAVGFDATSESHTGTAGSVSEATFQWTHLGTANARGVLIFVVNLDNAAGANASFTYGGVAVPAIPGGAASDAAGEPGRCGTFFLGAGVPTGNQTVECTRDNTAAEVWCCCITVTAAAGKETAVHEPGIIVVEGDVALALQAVTDGSPGSNSMRFAGGMSGGNNVPTIGTGSTLMHNFDTGNQTAAVCRETTAGQGARNVGFTAAADDVAFVYLAVKEVDPPTLLARGPKRISQAVNRASTY